MWSTRRTSYQLTYREVSKQSNLFTASSLELTVLGELRHEGALLNNNKPREVFLFDTMLIIAKPKEDKRLQFKNYIHVSGRRAFVYSMTFKQKSL